MMYQKHNISNDGLMKMNLDNMLNGGSALPQINIRQEHDYYLLKVKLPGVDPTDYKVEIYNHQLHIYHMVSMGQDESTGESIIAPHLLTVVPIPREVNKSGIQAHTEGESLNIMFPIDETAQDFHQEIDIEHL